MTFPRLALVQQDFPAEALADPESAAYAEVLALGPALSVRPGGSVAVTAGSRGINAIPDILRGVCRALRDLGLAPFICPSMGSHGQATAEGQTAVLAAIGVSEESIGVPIRSGMDTILLGQTDSGLPIHQDRIACEADGIFVVNRVKAHTKFKGPLESGLCKMLVIGLGNHLGATICHRHSVRLGFPRLLDEGARFILANSRVIGGLGIVENAHSRAHTVKALRPDGLITGETALLDLAKQLSAKLPVREIDLLIVDEIGKDISGTGMDTNVTGRNRDILGDFTVSPRCARVFVRDLTPAAGGNALGIGFADFTTDRLVAKINMAKTVTNALTGLSPEKAAIPIHFPTDREAIQVALDSLGLWDPATVRVVRIQNTLRLERILVSAALLPLLPGHASALSAPQDMPFGPDGNLPPL